MDEHQIRDFEVEIIDKYSKGILRKRDYFSIWRRDYFSIKFIEDVTPKYRDILVRHAVWAAFNVGDTVMLPMQKADGGLWYPQKADDGLWYPR